MASGKMAGHFRMRLVSLLFLLNLLGVIHSQRLTMGDEARAFLGENVCSTLTSGTIEDNLSCANIQARETMNPNDCLVRSELCDGIQQCFPSGEDEAEGTSLNNLVCNFIDPASSTFQCGPGVNPISIDLICDGNADCGGDNSIDEISVICDNKCLLPYYGGCDLTRECLSASFIRTCGGCLSGYVDVGSVTCAAITFFEFVASGTAVTEGDPGEVVSFDLCIRSSSVAATYSDTLDASVFGFGPNGGVPEAMLNSDFITTITSLTFDQNNPEQCFTFFLVNDLVQEQTEQFQFTFTLPASDTTLDILNPGDNVATVTISDNDIPELELFIASGATENGELVFAGEESSGQVIATVAITNGVTSSSDIGVICSSAILLAGPAGFTDDLARAADLGGGAVTTTITAGNNGAQCIIPVVNDLFIENDEIFSIEISLPVGTTGAVLGPTNTGIGRIPENDDPQFGFQDADLQQSEVEADAMFNYVIEIRNGVSFDPFLPVIRQLQVISQDVSATAGMDYVAISVVEDINSSPDILTFELLDDDVNEAEEEFTIQLFGGGANVGVDPTANVLRVFIMDDDLVTFEFDMSPVVTAEVLGNQNVLICVNLASGILTLPIDITLTPASGVGPSGATGDVDFNDDAITLTFGAGATPGEASGQQCGTILILDDVLIEGQEFFTVTATPDRGMFVGAGATVTVQIDDNDNFIVQFVDDTVEFREDMGPASVRVQLAPGSGILVNAAMVNCQTLVLGTATSIVDYQPANNNLNFAGGSGPGSFQDFMVTLANEDLVEADETFVIRCTVLTGAGTFVNGMTSDDATVTIENDDELVVEFQQAVYEMVEASNQMVCLAVVSGTLDAGITVDVTITTSPVFVATPVAGFGTVQPATQTTDYNPIPVPNVVSFPTVNTCVTLQIVDDDEDEPQEVFFVNAAVTGGPGSAPAPGNSAAVVISDDDLLVIGFNQILIPVNEGGPSVQVCLDLVFGVVGSIPLVIDIVSDNSVTSMGCDGNAMVNEDFNPISELVTFPPGAAAGDAATDQQCFFITAGIGGGSDIINDMIVELLESMTLIASSANPDVEFTAAGGNMATLQIMDDDMVTVGLSLTPTAVDEGAGSVQGCAMLTGANPTLGCPVMVRLYTEDETATSTDNPNDAPDYCALDRTITINPGEENMQFCEDIDIIDDDLCEFTETFLLNGGSVGPGTIIANSPLMATIIDNDVATISSPETEYTFPENIPVISIPLVLTGQKAPGRQCVVTASTMDGTAISTGMDADYVMTVQTLIFDNDTTFNPIEVEFNDDGRCEGAETFQVMLSTDSDGCAIPDGASPITVTIDDDEIGRSSLGDDPHFSIVLPSGKLLCYTVQGEHGFSFNLISNKKMTMNAKFVPDSRRSEVTWIGSMGIVVRDNTYKQANATALRFEARERKVYIGDKVELEARNIERLTFKNGKLTISEAPPSEGFKYPSLYVDLQDVEITFTMKFMNEHLDIFWHRTGGKIPDSHGLIGQFFRKGVSVDEVRKILIMPNKEPVPVMRRPVWSFMEREQVDDQLCWTAMNPGYQGEGLIDGHYFDYLVDDVMTSEYQYTKKQ